MINVCAGNFTIPAALRSAGYAGDIACCDVSLYTSALGAYLTGTPLDLKVRPSALNRDMKSEDGYIGVESKPRELIGRTGIADSVLRPSGKVIVDNEIYDAKSEYGFINKGEKVKVVRYETGQLYVVKEKGESE